MCGCGSLTKYLGYTLGFRDLVFIVEIAQNYIKSRSCRFFYLVDLNAQNVRAEKT